jgi:competence protein ComEC
MRRGEKLWRFWVKLAVVMLAVVLLFLRFAGSGGERDYVRQFFGKTVEVTGTVFDDPDIQPDGLMKLRLNKLNFGGVREAEANLYVTVGGGKDIQRSDRVTVSGKLGTDFGSFAGSVYRGEVVKIERPEPGDLALEARDAFGSLINERIDEPESKLALGYLLGQRRTLPNGLVEVLKTVGLTHIVVASGYNLTILVRFMRRIFGKVSRFASFFFALLLVFGFIAVTGASPSMVRAGVVSVFSLVAWYFGRDLHPARLLMMTAFLTLMMSPTYLSDLGWQLSMAAFAGIMLFAPVATKYFYGDKKPNFAAQVVVETLSATIFTLPILLFNFGLFSLLALPANVLILPTIPFVMAATFLTGVFFWFTILSQAFALISSVILKYHIAVMDFFAGQSWALVETNLSVWGVGIFYGVVFGVWFYMKKVSKAKLRKVNIVKWDYEEDD